MGIQFELIFVDWLGEVFPFVETSVFVFVELQVSWASDTSNSNSFPASNVLSGVSWISDVSIKVWSVMGTFVWTLEGSSWVPFLCGDTFVLFSVQTLVTILTEFQAQWPASLTVSQSTGALKEVVWVVFSVVIVFKISIRFSFAQGIRTFDLWWCGSSDWWVGDCCSN